MLQVLVSSAKPCDSPDERLIIHHVSPPPPLPLHLHLRPARDAGNYHHLRVKFLLSHVKAMSYQCQCRNHHHFLLPHLISPHYQIITLFIFSFSAAS